MRKRQNLQPLYPTLSLLLFLLLVSGCTAIKPLPETNRLGIDDTFSHDTFGKVLQNHVDDKGRVDYASLVKQPEDIELYYDLLTRFSPDSHPEFFPTKDDELAYWINAYNAGVIKTVISYYPIESVLDVKNPPLLFFLTNKAGFFFFQRLTFGEATTSLYYLENSVIRDRYKDPRIHFVLNCASIGCPQLPQQPFTGMELEQQLEFETKKFIGEQRNYSIDHSAETIFLSSIFKWYKDDFLDFIKIRNPDTKPVLADYISLYLDEERKQELAGVRDKYKVEFTTYDWGLNSQ